MKFLFIFLSLFVSTLLLSQAPEGINYQAVMRNSSGNLVTNSTVAIRVQIRQGSATGTTVYQERQSVASSSQGLINMVIGAGTPQVGTFNNINWAVGSFFVNLAVDFSNGVNYQDFGTQQLMSVPYALYAKKSGAQLNQWRYGNTIPTNSFGVLGDFYLDVVTGNVYYKNSTTTWVLTGNIKGPVGPSGTTGAQGAQGIQGLTGSQGIQGATGAQGNQGIQGVAGTNGTNGTNGKNTLVKTTTETAGANCTTGGVKIEYGLDANGNGTLDISEINATLTKYVCNGAVGATGATGAQGIQGVAGTNGSQGIQGVAGATGSQGIQGVAGPTGATGAQGIQGAPGSQNAWSLTGNNGTNTSTNFIGTTDAQDWVIKTNNTERMRITSFGNVGIGLSNPTHTLQAKNSLGSLLLSSATGATFVERVVGVPLTVIMGINNNSTNFGQIELGRGSGIGESAYISCMGDGLNGVSSVGILFQTLGLKFKVQSNGNVGIGVFNPQRSLHVNDVMRLEPRATAPTSPAKGDMYFDSTLNKLRVYDGITWQNCW